ncbi:MULTISPECIES: helix-turn-helix transcriptional regulator [unclassified Streptomyces]|uniref:helix-turn-helix transcriptional regulator n=1 Tax=unclassified Streptomyces TaxID=2593676 RepID=UPI002DD8CE9C|nr:MULTISPECIES: helix-turn-helix transcriptional regulator [unclassified Streptomyces]WSA95144.1 helix-turn-helix transcriptional regulator [Streptomyces sp. NBC_01795]WSB79566.1 helix-turn-helix transcriptional regulator [Streptomyces sp. NBC_01775]WSS12231.1 helix-turn-helix transcriptional regulator [Streptomyces sp. NBC_01186]WSS40944.1 helix-turn-helix transcriptional regulator [Streptomyces sp. NBC_01187]
MPSMLDALDLDPVQQQIYEALVDGAVTVTELRSAVDLSAARVRAALSSLENLSLVGRFAADRGGEERYLPVAPEIAFESLLLAREEEIHRTRRHIQLLAARFRVNAVGRDPLDLVEIVTGRAAVIRQVDQLQRSARQEIRGIDRPPYANSDPDRLDPKTGMMPVQAQMMQRGVGYRVIYDTDGLATFHRLDTDIGAAAELGEDARVMVDTPTKMLIADDRIALIPLRAAPNELASSVVVHPSGLLEVLCEFFEVLWSRALPISEYLSGHRDGAPDGPGPDEAKLLALLTTGMTDQVMARQLGISYRTFQRRLHGLMERLGATTRFQLGMRAASLGWVTPTPHSRTPEGSPEPP